MPNFEEARGFQVELTSMVHVERHRDCCTNEDTELNGNILNDNDFDKVPWIKTF